MNGVFGNNISYLIVLLTRGPEGIAPVIKNDVILFELYLGVTHKYKNQKKSEISDLGRGEGAWGSGGLKISDFFLKKNYKIIKCSKLPKTQNKPIKVFFFNFRRGWSELRKISTGS